MMAKLTYADGIAIWRLIYFSFSLLASLIVSWRHGFGKNSGWIYLAIFCAIKIINSSAQLATISTSDSTTAETVAVITGFMGLSPLLLASLGVLSRVYYSILKMPWNFVFTFLVLKTIQTPAAIALILCIVGATSAGNADDVPKQSTVQAGVVIFLIVFVAIIFLTIGAMVGYWITGRGERKLLLAVTCSLPILLVRVIYSMLSTFSDERKFSPTGGSETAELFLASIEEMVVVLVYIWAGLSLQSTPPDASDEGQTRLMHRVGRGDFGGGKLGILSFGAAVVDELWSHRSKEPDAGFHHPINTVDV